jgi:hypothetical protein
MYTIGNKKGMLLLLIIPLMIACTKNKELTSQPVLESQSALSSQPSPGSRSLKMNDSADVSVTVFASNIAFPRGLKFGPDGYLYVALAGFGGPDSTIGQCTQVKPPVGPYHGGNTSKIIKISSEGSISTVVENLPSSKNALGFTTGVADVQFVGNTLYALLVAGCSHGNPDYPSSVIKVNYDGSWSVIADLSTYVANNPVAAPDSEDFEPDGDPYSLINVRGDLYAIEPNHGELIKVTTNGDISRVLDFSAHFGHIVPTAVTYEGDFFVGNLRTFPLVAGSSDIYKVSPDGDVRVWATGFTGVLGVAFDDEHRLYVLETSAGGGPIPNTGRVVRINNDNSRDVIVDSLNFPTAMTFGPDEALYISDTGFGPPSGQILKVEFNNDHDYDNHNRHSYGYRNHSRFHKFESYHFHRH